MTEFIQRFTRGVLVALVLRLNPNVNNSQRFVAEAFSKMGKQSVVLFKNHKNLVISASRNLDPLQEDRRNVVIGQPPYKIGGIDLSALWIDLVRRNKVSASMTLPSPRTNARDDFDKINDGKYDENLEVEYGIKLVEKNTENPDRCKLVYEEYVRQLGLESDSSTPSSIIANINATLTRRQQQTVGLGIDFEQVGNFVAQLQLVRTLRPPPSEGFRDATSSYPPTYNWKTDSFVVGPLRLDLRPLVGRIKLSKNGNNGDKKEDKNDEGRDLLKTSWDVFHNISPADRRGHFLLLPSLLDKELNWRGQYLTKDDCFDLVHIAGTIEPAGSMFLGYNSVGAGASQNHIHCHSWPCQALILRTSTIRRKRLEVFPMLLTKSIRFVTFVRLRTAR